MPKSALCYTQLSIVVACALLTACASPSAPTAKRQSGVMTGEARERIAGAAEASGDTELALSMYAAASDEAPTNSEFRLRYADMLLRVGKIGPARDLLTQSLATASDPMEIRRGLGAIHVLSGQSAEAITVLDAVLVAKPEDVRALVDKAVALDLQGRHADAQQLYSRARQLAPDDASIVNNLALSMALEGRVRAANDLLTPFKGAENVPERMKINMRIFSAAIGGVTPTYQVADGQKDGEEIRRMALAFEAPAVGNAAPIGIPGR